MQRLNELERENAELRKLVAEPSQSPKQLPETEPWLSLRQGNERLGDGPISLEPVDQRPIPGRPR